MNNLIGVDWEEVKMNNQKILIIDDDPDYTIATKVILKREGYQVISAVDGNQGIEKARSEKPDLILMDVMLPDIDGFSIWWEYFFQDCN